MEDGQNTTRSRRGFAALDRRSAACWRVAVARPRMPAAMRTNLLATKRAKLAVRAARP